jgi:SP family sugar:H+ symporter-like MFS transporter
MIGKGREEDALQFLVEYHGNGDAQDPLVLFEFEEMKEAINREKAAKAEKWSQILKYRANLHRLGLAALMMFCTSLSGCKSSRCITSTQSMLIPSVYHLLLLLGGL